MLPREGFCCIQATVAPNTKLIPSALENPLSMVRLVSILFSAFLLFLILVVLFLKFYF